MEDKEDKVIRWFLWACLHPEEALKQVDAPGSLEPEVEAWLDEEI